jgi:uncharacterized protein YxeA
MLLKNTRKKIMKKIIMTVCGVALMSIVTLAQQTDTTRIQNSSDAQQNQATQGSNNAQQDQSVQQDSTDQATDRQTRKRNKKQQKDEMNSADPNRERKKSNENPK